MSVDVNRDAKLIKPREKIPWELWSRMKTDISYADMKASKRVQQKKLDQNRFPQCSSVSGGKSLKLNFSFANKDTYFLVCFGIGLRGQTAGAEC